MAFALSSCVAVSGGEDDTKTRLRKTLLSKKEMTKLLERGEYDRLKEMVKFCRSALFLRHRLGTGPRAPYELDYPQDVSLVQAAIRRLRREKGRRERELLAEYIAMAATHQTQTPNKKLATAIRSARSDKHSSRTRFALNMASLYLSELDSAQWSQDWLKIMTEPIPVVTNLTNSIFYKDFSPHRETAEKTWTMLVGKWGKMGDKGKAARESFVWRIYIISMRHPEADILDPFIRISPELLKLCMKSYPHSTRLGFRYTVRSAITDSFVTYKGVIDSKEREAFIRKMVALEDDPRLKGEWQKLLKEVEELIKEKKGLSKAKSPPLPRSELLVAVPLPGMTGPVIQGPS